MTNDTKRILFWSGLGLLIGGGLITLTVVLLFTACTPSDTPTPTHTAQDTTVYVFPDTVYIMQPDTMIWRGRTSCFLTHLTGSATGGKRLAIHSCTGGWSVAGRR
jgi:hypothetical protein